MAHNWYKEKDQEEKRSWKDQKFNNQSVWMKFKGKNNELACIIRKSKTSFNNNLIKKKQSILFWLADDS